MRKTEQAEVTSPVEPRLVEEIDNETENNIVKKNSKKEYKRTILSRKETRKRCVFNCIQQSFSALSVSLVILETLSTKMGGGDGDGTSA